MGTPKLQLFTELNTELFTEQNLQLSIRMMWRLAENILPQLKL